MMTNHIEWLGPSGAGGPTVDYLGHTKFTHSFLCSLLKLGVLEMWSVLSGNLSARVHIVILTDSQFPACLSAACIHSFFTHKAWTCAELESEPYLYAS